MSFNGRSSNKSNNNNDNKNENVNVHHDKFSNLNDYEDEEERYGITQFVIELQKINKRKIRDFIQNEINRKNKNTSENATVGESKTIDEKTRDNEDVYENINNISGNYEFIEKLNENKEKKIRDYYENENKRKRILNLII